MTLSDISKFEKLKQFDSWVFFDLLEPKIPEEQTYRNWWNDTERKWIVDFNGNRGHYPENRWNEESGIGSMFKGEYFSSKFYRYDGTEEVVLPLPIGWKKAKGVLIRDHYSESAVIKVHTIADNLQEFLSHENINHQRLNLKRDGSLA